MQPKEDDLDTQSRSSSLILCAHFPKNSCESGFVNIGFKKTHRRVSKWKAKLQYAHPDKNI